MKDTSIETLHYLQQDIRNRISNPTAPSKDADAGSPLGRFVKSPGGRLRPGRFR